MQSNGSGTLRIVRQEDGCEILVHHASPIEGPRHGGAATDFLDVQTFGFVVVLMLDAAGGIGRRTKLIAEAGRPHGEGGHQAASLHHRGFDMHYVSVIEAESLADCDILVRVLKSDLHRSAQIARTRGDVKGGVNLVALGLVVNPERKRVSVFLRRIADQLQGLAVVIAILLQNPRFDPASPVGERNADRKSTRLNSSHGYISYA